MASVAAMGLPAVLRARSANERLNIALVGVGGRGADNFNHREQIFIYPNHRCWIFGPLASLKILKDSVLRSGSGFSHQLEGHLACSLPSFALLR
jgi:hypothetical protein